MATNFYHQILKYLNHVIRILLRRYVVVHEETLDFLNGHRVEEHAYKLQENNSCWFNGITWWGRYVTEPTRRKSGGNEVDGEDVLLLKFVVLDAVGVDEGLVEPFLHRKNNHDACQNMDFDQGLKTKSKDL